MQSFFAQAKADISAFNCFFPLHIDPTAASASSSYSASGRSTEAHIAADARADHAIILDSAVFRGRNAPAAAGDAAHPPEGGRHGAARALANLRDAAQQLGAHSLSAVAAAAAAAVAAAEAHSGGRRGPAAAATAAVARVRRELRRAEAAWAAVDSVGTARAVRVAVQSVFSGSALRPPPLALRFRPAPPPAALAPAARQRGDWPNPAERAAAGSGRALAAAAGVRVRFYHRR
jgi:hypothetical protein